MESFHQRLAKNKCVVEKISTTTGMQHLRFTNITGGLYSNIRDGSFIFYNNSIGDYESLYHDDLKIQMYECLGNHSHEFRRFY